MRENKTKKTENTPKTYIDSLDQGKRKDDFLIVYYMLNELLPDKPIMWGDSIVGYGELTYKYANGKENTWMKIGLSARKQAVTLYVVPYNENIEDKVAKLGLKMGKSCVYIKNIDSLNLTKFKEFVLYAYGLCN